jgi:arginine N-succinyltransferase
MSIIRPIAERDLDALISMAHESGVGFTSLPDNPELMEIKLARAIASFSGELPPEQCHYMFVMQESADGPVVGLCGIEARIGQDDVWYNYRLGAVIQASKALGVYRRTPTLFLSNDLTGATELGSLFLRQPARRNRNGSVLSKCRMMFLAAFPELFSQRVIAEMRGYSDDLGRSPFWDGLGRRFFNIEFSDADFLTGSGDKVFIAELMPKFPIYIPMLPSSAQQAIANVHPHTEPALAMLQAEGFRKNGYVDIFDAGPTIECELNRIDGVTRSFVAQVCINADPSAGDNSRNNTEPAPRWLIGNDRFCDFRVIGAADVHCEQSQITLTAEQADRLHVADGDTVRIMSIQPEEARNE